MMMMMMIWVAEVSIYAKHEMDVQKQYENI